jgi:hypothetical protein
VALDGFLGGTEFVLNPIAMTIWFAVSDFDVRGVFTRLS